MVLLPPEMTDPCVKADLPIFLGKQAPPPTPLSPMKVSRESLEQVSHLPVKDACVALNMGQTMFKRVCRQYGIARWPCRQLHSLDQLIVGLPMLPKNVAIHSISVDEILALRKAIQTGRVRDIDDNTRRLHQVLFRVIHKQRVAAQTVKPQKRKSGRARTRKL